MQTDDKSRRLFKSGDGIVLAAALVFCALTAVLCWRTDPKADTVTVTVHGELFGSYPLDEDRVITLPGNTVIIEDGTVRMWEADCPDGLCLRQGRIRAGMLVCLPNRVVVRLDAAGSNNSGVDAVVGRLAP